MNPAGNILYMLDRVNGVYESNYTSPGSYSSAQFLTAVSVVSPGSYGNYIRYSSFSNSYLITNPNVIAYYPADTSGNFVVPSGTPSYCGVNNEPFGIAAGNNGYVYVSEVGNGYGSAYEDGHAVEVLGCLQNTPTITPTPTAGTCTICSVQGVIGANSGPASMNLPQGLAIDNKSAVLFVAGGQGDPYVSAYDLSGNFLNSSTPISGRIYFLMWSSAMREELHMCLLLAAIQEMFMNIHIHPLQVFHPSPDHLLLIRFTALTVCGCKLGAVLVD